ncbi:MAG: hypothetical protein IBJ08_14955, partial [Pseudomonas sp.]|nr:hypothetical protein [Pseudomonas sp.]
ATQVTEMIGSGPFRFRAGERVAGARLAYERFEGYVPREGGTASGTAGPKRAHFDRVEWHIIPDPSTAMAALQRGEIDFKYPDSPHWAGAQKAGMAMHYSRAVVDYVDGVLVAPQRQGMALESIHRLAMVQGWTPRGYESSIDSGQIQLNYSDDLRQMIRQALKQDTDGAYFNVVVATHYLDNIRARPGALVFDPRLPHTRGSFHLSSQRHPQLIARFDQFLAERSAQVAALKADHRVEANLNSEYMGVEQWKVDFLERQKAKAGAQAPASSTR